MNLTPDKFAVSIPGATVGMLLYSYDDTLFTDIVLHVTSDNKCLCTTTNPLRFLDNEHSLKTTVEWATEEHFKTPIEALKAYAEQDKEWHVKGLAFANAVLDAIKNGDDITPFLDGQQQWEQAN